MKSFFIRRWVFASVSLCLLCAPASAAAGSGSGREPEKLDPGILLTDALRVQGEGCVDIAGGDSFACAAVPSLVENLNSVGEFLAAAVTCAALESRNSLPEPALIPCAIAETRLGGASVASGYLDRFVRAAAGDADALDRTLKAADILISGTRYRHASPYLDAAARLAARVDPSRSVSISKSVFMNCLNAADQSCAARAARELGADNVAWVIGEYTARGFAKQALEPVRTLVSDGVGSYDELGVAVSVYSALSMPVDAVAAANSCLERCPGADTMSVASVLTRGGMAAEAAVFADRNRAKFAVPDDAGLEIGFLLLAAGQTEKGANLLSDWAIPAQGRKTAGIDFAGRQVRVEKRLLADGRFDLAATFGAAVRKAGGHFPADVAPEMISALLKSDKADDAFAAANEILSTDAGCGTLRYRLSALFYGAGEFESSLALIEPCSGSGVSTVEDPLLPARVHLLRARLTRGGYLAGDVSGELIQAYRAAGRNRDLIESIDKFASTLAKDTELELVAAESLVAVTPDDPDVHNRLAMARIAAGDEDGAVASFRKAVELQKPGAVDLSTAVDALLGAGFINGAVGLYLGRTNVEDVPPSLAYRIGLSCMDSGDRECVSIFVSRFLDGPVSDEINYYELCDTLISSGWYGLAGKTLDVAAKANPKDRSARDPWLRGRLALMSGDERGARTQYEKAVQEAPVKGLIVMAISGDYARAGQIAESVRWLRIGVEDESPDVRAQVFPMWVDTLRRLGRSGDITIEPLRDVEVASLEDWERSINLLEASGRADLAIELVNRVKENVKAADLGPLLVRLTGLHIVARDRDGALAAAGAACGWAVSFGGDHCIEAAALLKSSGLGLDGLTTPGEFGPAATAELSAAGIASLVAMTLREKGVDSAFAAARLVRPSVYLEASSLSDLMQNLQAAGGPQAWDSFLSQVAARPEMARDGNVLLDAALAAFAVQDAVRAREMLKRYMDSPSGDAKTAFMALVADGRFDDADAVLKAAPEKFWTSLDDEQLGRVVLTYQLRGAPDGVEEVFSRFLAAAGGSTAARQTVSRVRLNIGDWRGAARDLAALPESSLGPDSRAAIGFSLWRAGDRPGAMEHFRKVAGLVPEEQGLTTEQYRVIGFLDGQAGAGAELSEVLAMQAAEIAADPELAMAAALVNVSVNDDAHLAAARKALYQLLRTARSVTVTAGSRDNLNIREYVIAEARRGSAGELGRDALRMRGASFAQTAMYAACLAGDDQTFRLAKEKLFPGRLLSGGPDGVADPADLLSAAGITFACGRFNDAADLALRYINGGHVDSEGMPEAIVIAVKASAAAGRKNPVTPAYVSSITDDILLRTSFVTTAAATYGNAREVFKSLEGLLPAMPGAQSLVIELVSARITSGQHEGLAQYALNLVRALPDQSTACHSVYETISGAFLFGEAAAFARMAMATSPDREQAAVDLFSALMELGDTEGAIKVAEDTLFQKNVASRTAVGLAASAAVAGRLPVTLRLVERIIEDRGGAYTSTLPPALAGVALRTVQFLDAAMPGSPQARDFLDKCWDWSTDRQYFCATAVKSLTDAWHEPGDLYIANVSRLFADGRCTSPEMADRLQDTVAALGAGAAAYGRFKASWPLDDLRRLVRAAAFTAILQGRVDDALSWLDGVSVPGFTAAENIQLLVEATDFLNDRPGLPDADVVKIASAGLRYLREHAAADQRYSMAEATFVSLMHDMKAFLAFMDREIAFDPSSEHNRNMLAYSLSVRGKDQARFRKEARLAVALGGADRGGYMETEAWGNFVYGGGARSVEMQRAASAYWNTAAFSSGLPECFNHYGAMLDAIGRDAEAVEMYRRSVMTSDGWDWHGILSARMLNEMGFFKTVAGD